MSDLRRLARLQRQDDQLQSLEARRDALVLNHGLEERVTELEGSATTLRQDLKTKQARQRDLELEVQSISAKRKGLEAKLYSGKSSNPKELAGWQQDIDQFLHMERQKEDHVLALMEEIELAQQTLKEEERALQEAAAAFAEARTEHDGALGQLESEIGEARSQRDAVTRELEEEEPDLLDQYQRIMTHKGDSGLAVIERGSCGVCGVLLPEPAIRKAQEFDISLCHRCGRILYYT